MISRSPAHHTTIMSSKGKGKAVDHDHIGPAPVHIPPMQNPSTGSANPSASFPALWNYLAPALDHIVRSPTNTPVRAPTIDVAYHMGIHTAVYNYFTAASRFDMSTLAAAPPPRVSTSTNGRVSPTSSPHGADLYEKLDKYYADVCQELLASAPVDDSSILRYLLPCFSRYAAGARSVDRLLNYVNRHYVKRAVEEDRGWLRLADILDAVAQAIEQDGPATTLNQNIKTKANTSTGPREQLAARLRDRRLVELKKWGYTDGAPPAALTRAEAAAEAASPLDRIIPLASMAFRRFREDVIRPLLAVPKGKKARKRYKKPPGAGSGLAAGSGSSAVVDGESSGPKSRLARGVRDLIESKDVDSETERRTMAAELDDMLGTIGIPIDLLLRRKLDKFALRPKG
ncbi:hypothetical protein EW145_g698 [Phellinidium pouzarii]|uniref:Uncharacterized protein n=1 Tax=Phellinidium pouzarii TaxID=167371 RepID=A0A4S4LJ34_9AGAM|nr:hypothetical protein EW145_g698 [Phellinidium pouzarii]